MPIGLCSLYLRSLQSKFMSHSRSRLWPSPVNICGPCTMIHNANYFTCPPAEEMSHLCSGIVMRHCLFVHLLVIFVILFSSAVFGFPPSSGLLGFAGNHRTTFPGFVVWQIDCR
ncbi:hypothetical protein BDV33DRAFT_172898 [Aspergillus novoparasiticus]|uniref:Uncharacterized protein n=1 Tax=Aspergillus novoparasiticus TaxID=986946 RepID=A0A5N6EQR1_9EURO|nr:hypothetical protein BDV33DRAFT_172898 [Aspergillus novoparasiticus]